MARNNPEVQTRGNCARNNHNNNNGNNNRASNKYCGSSPKYFKSITPPMSVTSEAVRISSTSPRLSPRATRVATPPSSSLGSSPRTSPGLLAGHYAGCKFTEPPLPSALPLPPQHWMQPHHTPVPTIGGVVLRSSSRPAFGLLGRQEPDQLAQQLKVLLKVQA